MSEIALSRDDDVTLCALADLADPGSMVLSLRRIDDSPARVMVLRKGGKVFAYEDVCPHIPLPLEQLGGKVLDSDGRRIYCANHGALFEVDTGLCVKGLCEGKSLTPFAVQVRDGRVIHPAQKLPPGR
ncbi:MAG: Rieske 2Fe-2S domain-containing protein [Magnetospirillum sp.]|nr:Rieske 2Fe-2S domain-containing protein [Magnetospirillum sp.]